MTDPRSHYEGLAREAELLAALREALGLQEASALEAWGFPFQTREQQEDSWDEEEPERYRAWVRLAELAGIRPKVNFAPVGTCYECGHRYRLDYRPLSCARHVGVKMRGPRVDDVTEQP